MSGPGSTGARPSPCSVCSGPSSRSTFPRSAPTPGRFGHPLSPGTALSGPSSVRPTAAGTSASCARPRCSPASSSPRSRSSAGGQHLAAVAPRVALRRGIVLDRRARDAAPGGAAGRLRALVPCQRLDLSDRAGRELVRHGHTPYGHDYERLRPGALLQPRRHRAAAGRAPAGRAPALRVLPGTAAHGGGLDLCSLTVRRLPRARPARHDRLLLRGAPLRRAAALAARDREHRRGEPARSFAAPGSAPPTRRRSWRCSSPSRC